MSENGTDAKVLVDRFIVALEAVVANEGGQIPVAQAAGISQSMVSRMLRRERLPNMDTLLRLLVAYPHLASTLLPENMLNDK